MYGHGNGSTYRAEPSEYDFRIVIYFVGSPGIIFSSVGFQLREC